MPDEPTEVTDRLDRLEELLFAPWGMGSTGRVFMNAVTFCEIRTYRWRRLDPHTMADLLKLGWQGYFHKEEQDGKPHGERRQIWVSRLVPEHRIFIDPIESVTPFPRATEPSDDELIPLDGFPVVKPIPIPETPEGERVQAPKPADCCDKGREYIKESPLAGKVYMRMTVQSERTFERVWDLVTYCPWCGTKLVED